MNYESKLKALVEEAYSLFSSYTIGEKIEACCGHCMTMEDCELLLTLPLTQIDQRLISNYLNAAETIDQYAVSQQMKYFLPKFLDFLVQGIDLCHSNEIIFGKCYISHENSWTTEEIEFMQRFARCYFQMQLTKFEETESVCQFIIMFYLGGLDIHPLLDDWAKALDQPMPMLNLIQMLHYEFEDYGYDQAFSDENLIQIMNQWLKNLRNNELLINALVDVISKNDIPPEYQYMYDSAFDQLQIKNG